jgi:hypothetical protein
MLAALALGCSHADPYAVLGTSARNPEQGLRASFDERRVSLEPVKGDWHGALELVGYGCADHVTQLGAARPRASERRVEYLRTSAHGAVREWYENTPQGLEQGFTLEQAPCAEGDVSLRVATGSLTPRLSADGKAIDLLDAGGATRLHYTNLSAVDAAGQNLKVAMNVQAGQIALQVDAQGAQYPIVVDPLVWSPQGDALVASNGVANDGFGYSVAISGDTAIVGTPFPSYGANTNQGAAYAFFRTGTSWAQQGPPLAASDGAKFDSLGWSVAVSGNTAVVGAPIQKVGANYAQGAVYVFVRSGTTWAQQAKLLADDGAMDDYFGRAVAIDGDTLAVGGYQAEAVYVFVRSGTTWTQQGSKLVADDAAAGSADFGDAVALSGNTLLVGAPGKSVGNRGGAGVAYVFVRSGTTWTQQGPSFTSSDIHSSDHFGDAVSLSGETALIGAPGKLIGNNAYQGAAYAFVRSGTTWSQQGPSLTASGGLEADEFGWSVALAGNTAVIGAPWEAQGTATEQGAAYVFVRSGTTWAQSGPKLTAGAATSNFGHGVAISSNTLVAGAPGAAVGQVKEQGTAFVYFRAGASGDPCSGGADCANGFCSDGVCCDQACDGACDSCSVAAGAAQDGTCKVSSKGAAGTPACATLACNGVNATCVACAHDGECTPDHYCAANGSCQPQVAQGDSCDPRAGKDCKEASCDVCATGNCADGVCCDQACTDACVACALALTGTPDGQCAPVPADQDPKDKCAEGSNYPTSCLSDGLCDGQGNCRDFAKPSTPCGDTQCAKGSVSGKLCDGSGTCSTDSASCAPYVCGTDACTSDCQVDDDCAASGYCLNGTCQTKKDPGKACGSAVQCASNFCTDGVCCEAACDGQCEVCSDAGACEPVLGDPRAGRPACSGDPDVCGGTCDGQTRDHCTYPSSAQLCGSSCADGQQLPSVCDAEGACVESSAIPCGNYACGETECLTTCANAGDCAEGFSCAAASCIPTGSKCSDDLLSSVTEDDVSTLCAPYVCDASSGACKTECTNVDDCASGSVCNASKSCVPASGSKSGDSGGCGCSVPGQRTSRAAWLLLAALACGLRRRHSAQVVPSAPRS